MSLAERIEGAKLEIKEINLALDVDDFPADMPFTFARIGWEDARKLAQAQHAKDKSELLWGLVEALRAEERSDKVQNSPLDYAMGFYTALRFVESQLEALEIPKPEWAS